MKIGRRSFVLSLQSMNSHVPSKGPFYSWCLKSWYSLHTLSSRSEACKMSSNHSVVFRIRVGSHLMLIPQEPTSQVTPTPALDSASAPNSRVNPVYAAPEPDQGTSKVWLTYTLLCQFPRMGRIYRIVPRNPLPLNLFFSHDIRSVG